MPPIMEDLSERLAAVIRLIDRANSRDPRVEVDESAKAWPQELLYGQRMSQWLARFVVTPSEPLQIAARAQHIRRWEVPRSTYPQGRAGYLKWRSDLYRFHAEWTSELMGEVGYEAACIDRVQQLLQKKGLKKNPEAQALEDVACLVFLEFYFDRFAQEHDDDKIISIVRKTWVKMSPDAQEAALQIDLPETAQRLIERALQE